MNPVLVSTSIAELLPMARSGDPHRHVSAIIRSLCIKLGHFEGDDDSTMTTEELATRQTRWEMGSAFEEAIRHGLARRVEADNPHRYTIPGELELDGLIGSPDLLDLERMAIIEIKLTWMSTKHDPESTKFWKYWVQLKAYCHMWGTHYGYLHVGHVMGDYRNSGPVYNVWAPSDTHQFTDRELVDNWSMLRNEGSILARQASRVSV